jgi:hypothetical protein
VAKHDALSLVPDDDDDERFDQYELVMRLISAVEKADIQRVIEAGRDADAEELFEPFEN